MTDDTNAELEQAKARITELEAAQEQKGSAGGSELEAAQARIAELEQGGGAAKVDERTPQEKVAAGANLTNDDVRQLERPHEYAAGAELAEKSPEEQERDAAGA